MDRAVKAGYHITDTDSMAMGIELMNAELKAQSTYLTLTFEYVELKQDKQSWSKISPIWLDVGGCGDSDQPATKDSSFQYSMQDPFTANFSGSIPFIGGHLHDGGTHLEVLKNDNVLCDCVAEYSADAVSAGIDAPMGLSRISTCEQDMSMKQGDLWSLRAFYNTTAHAPMMEANKILAPVMGIALIYVAIDD
jgi:hypothetical protein